MFTLLVRRALAAPYPKVGVSKSCTYVMKKNILVTDQAMGKDDDQLVLVSPYG